MASFLGTESHRYDFDEGSGAILDKVGSADSTTTNGAPTYNGSTVSYDGIDDSHDWNATNKPFDASADFTHYLVYKILEATNGVVIRFIGGTTNDNTAPYLQWNDLGGAAINRMQAGGNGTGSAGVVSLDIGREANNEEVWVAAFSFEVSTKTLKAVFKSNDSVDPISVSGSDVGTAVPAAQGMSLAENFGQYGNLEIYKMGSVNGTAHTIADMQDTADALLAELSAAPSINTPASVTSRVTPRVTPLLT